MYLFVFISGTYYLLKLLRKGPQPVEQALLHPEEKTAQRPLSLPEELIEDNALIMDSRDASCRSSGSPSSASGC